MTPSPQEASTRPEIPDLPEQSKVKIVISGMSGLYPDSHSVKELSEVLYNKVNPISAKGLRYKYNHPEVVQFGGKVPEVNCFDAQFFKVHYRLSFSMDPMARKILENAYQAIYDAGVNPEHLSGKKIGVYIGTCFSETEKASFYEQATRSGIGIAGCSKTMFANRVSYWLNAKGPSMSIDEACCSSTAALEQAYLALSRGECEAAIVGGAYLCLHPQSSVHYGRLMKFCDDGKTKSFDENADGCAKSEAINVLFLQKAEDALRVYAQLLHAKSEFTSLLRGETGPKFGFERDINKAVSFVKNFYEEAKISPQVIEYVEAVGCAVPEADKMELQTIEQVYCSQRDTPLLVGSVLSNIGYNEAASGISGITKVLLGYHTGQLAANLHCSNPRKDVVALNDGRMRIVTEHESFGRTYAAVNGMSLTGVNSHVLMHGQYRPKDPNRYQSSIPYLVTVSGRHEEAVNYVLDNLKSQPIDPEQLRLLNNIHQSSIAGHLGRGFTILKTDEQQKTVSLCEKSEYFDDAVKPLWFVYSGMGSQWAGMGKQLMRFPIFAAAIEKCRRVLEPKGLDLVHIITTDDVTIFDNILHSFVGIAACQIGLTDILYALGLNPDGIIGHSVGELGCAYADGCLTAEEMILSAYSRGLVSRETPFIRGCMAAVGLGYEQIAPICPPEIDVACHNGPESSTISGPADIMSDFVAELTAKGIFAKDVPCSNIAYHSRYIAGAGPQLLKYLSEVIKSPKPRSKRWVSSSVPQDKWDTPAAQLCSAEYHTNNQLNSVLFDESSKLIPKNAVLVEIAPHGLLQAILKRSLASCTHIALTRRKHPDNAFMLLESIGKLFMEGYNTKLHVLYPEVQLPVSTGTPFLSHLVKWAHGEKWPLALYRSASRKTAATCNHIINTYDAESSYLQGHSMRGRTLYPFAATLVLVWDTLAMVLGVPKKQQSVKFTDLHLYAQPINHDLRQLKISVTVCRGTGNFEVLCENTKVVTGYINVMEKEKGSKVNNETINDIVSLYLTAEDIYKTLQDRDYSYNGEFRSIERANESFSEALLAWNNNWVTLIDGLFQLNVLRESHTAASVPTKIRVLKIDVQKHKDNISKLTETHNRVSLKAEVIKELNATRCGGISFSNVIFEHLPPVSEQKVSLKALKFVPNTQSVKDISSSLEVFFQIVRENVNKDSINAVGIVDQPSSNSVFHKINNMVRDVIGMNLKYEEINRETALKNKQNNFLAGADVVVVQNLSVDGDLLHHALRNNKFVISEEYLRSGERPQPSSLYRVISAHTLVNDDNSKQSLLQLARWGAAPAPVATTTFTVRTESDFDLLKSARTYMTSGHRLLIIAPYPPISGLKELIQTWRAETSRNKIDLIMVHENSNAYLSVNELPKIDLAISVLNNETWGGEYFVPVSDGATVSKNVTLQSGKIGDLDSLTWVEASETSEAGIDVMVHYAGLNKTDVKRADGSICNDAKNCYGMDFSGVTKGGQRVMGLVPIGAASTVVRAQPELLWPVPAHWSLEDAATVPLAYAHAFYCLAIKAFIRPGHNILVHGGTGALGQAVISIALGYGCQVFTTVSDARKKRFLLKLFPNLKADHIGYSRDATFRDMVKSITSGKGCDIVIHSSGENLKNSSVDCVAQNGCCVDVTQIIEQDDYEYGLYNLTRERNYRTTDCFTLFDAQYTNDRKAVYKMIVNGIASGLVRPLSRVSYAPHDVSRAFRLMAGSRHRGKVLLNMNDRTMEVQPRITCRGDRSHLILCNEEFYGLQFVNRLVERGAKNLCIHFKRQTMPYLQLKIRFWQKSGIKVLVFSDDLNEEMDITALVNSAARLGPLEGVYVMVGDKRPESYEGLVTSFDLVTRKLCSDIKYFAVLNVGSSNTVGKNTCLNRVQNKLPATLLSLPELSDEAGFYRTAMDTTERALRNGDAIQRASPLSMRQSSMLQKIAAIAKITISQNTDNSATLEDLGLKSENIPRVEYLLRVDYNVSFEREQIRLLTVETIIQLEKTLTGTELNPIEGLSNFYTYVDFDELLATTDIVFLPTLTNSASMRDDEFDVNQTFLCIVPGIEGHNHKFRMLCERLKLIALVLQPGLDRPHETVRETAERYAEVLLKKTGLQKTFYLLGYESGVSVALEVASILEDHGLTGVIYCIGYSPDGFKRVLEKQLSQYETKEQLQDAVARHMFTLMANGDPTGLDNALQGAKTWSQKVDSCVRTLLGRVSHSAQYARMLIETALVRIEKARDYVPTRLRVLRSQLVQLLPVVGGEEALAFSLQPYSQQPVIVHELQVPLAQAPYDLCCSSIINNFLSNRILEDFQTKNTCDTYLLDANSFMQLDVTA